MNRTYFVREITPGQNLQICNLPADVLTLVFSLLHGQDIARCVMVSEFVLF